MPLAEYEFEGRTYQFDVDDKSIPKSAVKLDRDIASTHVDVFPDQVDEPKSGRRKQNKQAPAPENKDGDASAEDGIVPPADASEPAPEGDAPADK